MKIGKTRTFEGQNYNEKDQAFKGKEKGLEIGPQGVLKDKD